MNFKSDFLKEFYERGFLPPPRKRIGFLISQRKKLPSISVLIAPPKAYMLAAIQIMILRLCKTRPQTFGFAWRWNHENW